MTDKELMSAAAKARENSYSPNSNYAVGAALLCADGTVYLGCNIESASYTPSICAERTAFSKAVSEGKRDFEAIAIVGGRKGETSPFCAPCGVCRQVMAEFCGKDFRVILGTPDKFTSYSFDKILPFAFTKDEL
ncbi:MAG: cytidine deaminase [Clostridiales bacterium]|nr:cytidine deaminase [Clostridiales bacterium]